MPAAPPSSPGKNGHVASRASTAADADTIPAPPLDLSRAATEPAEVQRAKSAQASPHWRPRAATGGRSSSNTVSPLLTWQPEPPRPGLPPGIATPGQPTAWMGKSPLLRAADPMQGELAGAPGLEGDLIGAPGLELSQPPQNPGDLSAEAPSAVLAAAVERAAAARAANSLAEGSGGIKEEDEEGEGDFDGDFEQLEGLDDEVMVHAATSGAYASPLVPGTPLDGTPLLGPSAPGRPRWASMTEEEMRKLPGASPILGPSPAHRPCAVPATPSPHLAPNPHWPTAQPMNNWLLPSAPAGQEQGFVPARKRWASVSDDEQASPMLWPTRSPLQRPRGKGGGAGPAGAAAGRRQGSNQQAFLLPQAHAGMQPMQPVMVPGDAAAAAAAAAADCWQPFPVGVGAGSEATVEAQQAAWAAAMRYWPPGGWGGCGAPFGGMPWGGMCDASYFNAGYGCGFAPAADGEAGAERANANTGYTVLWVGEAAFRASPSKKEQITDLGYDVRIYRSHDKCTKALSKKNNLSQGQTTFVVSQADASPILDYLRSRDIMNLSVVVDTEEKKDSTEAEKLASHPAAETNYLTVAHAWSDVLDALRTITNVADNYAGVGVAPGPVGPVLAAAAAAAHASASQGATSSAAPANGGNSAGGAVGSTAVIAGSGTEAAAAAAAAAVAIGAAAGSDTPWTLVWVSDQAFKPAAAALKAKLESMGCQVKGYKTHKNAARALDKKRVLVRTIVLLSGAEAPAFTTYLANRPELASTPVVVESNSRAAPVKPSATVKVADSFDEAVEQVWKLANDPSFRS